ncbi:hypothetical protein CFBP7129_27090 (plasmid) [Agrobacterium tumefaciens]|uniref:Uncharacterized protein n=1 Tax=Agrobacterium tumefaciens TaxID=358 RepID=A0A4D7Z5Q5_AGRTU|nr:hypothetical protein CFBP7129_27090 [Agrobacterium tumefaciens]
MLPVLPLFDHMFSVLSRLFPVPAAFFTVTGTGIVRTGSGWAYSSGRLIALSALVTSGMMDINRRSFNRGI